MTIELISTIVFGIIATTIGLVTIWQNFQIVQVKIESKNAGPVWRTREGRANRETVLQRNQDRAWYRYGM